MTKAFKWCGWNTLEPVDKIINKKMDITSPAMQEELLLQAGHVDFWWYGIPCDTLSNARGKPIPHHPHPPQRLRSKQELRGLPTLWPQEMARVDEANALIDFTAWHAAKVTDEGHQGCMENPANSLLWAWQEIQGLGDRGWSRIEYHACAWGGARRKAQALLSSMNELSAIAQGKCHHTHAPWEWDPYQKNGCWVYPSKEESDYPADFCLAVACAASFWALRNGFRMNLPASLPAVCTGDKEAQLEQDTRIERTWRFALKASKAGLDPRKYQEDLPYRLSMAEFKMLRPEKAVLIGDCAAGIQLTRSEWVHSSPPVRPAEAEAASIAHLHWLHMAGIPYTKA